MTRVFLAVYLALFAVHASDVLMALAPDDCVEVVQDALDSCADQCARCVCCARVLPSVTVSSLVIAADSKVALVVAVPDERHSSPHPHRILHVPKPSDPH